MVDLLFILWGRNDPNLCSLLKIQLFYHIFAKLAYSDFEKCVPGIVDGKDCLTIL
jgi:hypothetical protein